jgi:hypothetical protein
MKHLTETPGYKRAGRIFVPSDFKAVRRRNNFSRSRIIGDTPKRDPAIESLRSVPDAGL